MPDEARARRVQELPLRGFIASACILRRRSTRQIPAASAGPTSASLIKLRACLSFLLLRVAAPLTASCLLQKEVLRALKMKLSG